MAFSFRFLLYGTVLGVLITACGIDNLWLRLGVAIVVYAPIYLLDKKYFTNKKKLKRNEGVRG